MFDFQKCTMLFPTSKTIRSHKSSAGIPSKDDFGFCWTVRHWSLFLTHPTDWNKCMASGNAQCSSRCWFWIFKGCQQSLSLGTNPKRQCWAVFPTWQYCRWSFVWWMWEIRRAKRLAKAHVHFVADRARLFTDQRMSDLPIREKYTHFKTIWEHTLESSPTGSSSSFLKRWSSKWGLETLYDCSVLLFASSQYFSNAFFEHVLPCRMATRLFLREGSPKQAIS